MWYYSYLSFFLVFQSIICDEIPKNVTARNENETSRSITPQSSSNSSEKGKSEFRPSPQLETYYEFNKIPVPPAFPEAKNFFNLGESPILWPDSDQTWRPRIKFPTTTTPMPTLPTLKHHPYPFYSGEKTSNGKSYSIPITAPNLEKIPTLEDWTKWMDFEKKQLVQKNQFDFTASVPVEKPTYGAQKNHFDFTAPVPVEKPTYGAQKTSLDFGAIEKPSTQVQGNPWKKIVKVLTALVPIGLLLSALTPTVITVQSVNGTSRSLRNMETPETPSSKLISSLNYFNSIGCEDRILCELVLSASGTENAEQHVENLLNTFTKEGKAVEKADEMRRIFEAVKNQDCRTIVCKSMDKT